MRPRPPGVAEPRSAASQGWVVLDGPACTARPLHPEPMMKPLHDSMSILYRVTPAYDRPVGLPSTNSKNAGPNGLDPTQSIHPSVLERWDNDPKYRPAKLRDYFKRSGDTARASG